MASLEQRVEAMRRFNRFYTRRIGVLQERVLHSPFSLAEVRVLYELAHREDPTASDLGRDLGLDAGYLSRILRGFRRRGLVRRKASPSDGRRNLLALTELGRKAFAPLDARTRGEIRALLRPLDADEQDRLVASLRAVEGLLGPRSREDPAYVLRTHRPGDMGWIVHRHGALYSREYGWDERFEGLVAQIAGKFIARYDRERERCWIAERDGEIVGSVVLVKRSRTLAQLRLLYVEPKARGLGIGRRLVTECVQFARDRGYRRVVLWTNRGLDAARHLYEEAGFRLVKEEPHTSYADGVIAQTWTLKLG